jgi:Protein of unknown function (DUF3455)
VASLSKVIENNSSFLALMKKYLNFVEGSSSRSSDVNGIWELIRSIHLSSVIVMRHFLSATLTIALMSPSNLDVALSDLDLQNARSNNHRASLPIPAPLKVPSNQSLLFKAAAKGVQIYTCSAKSESATDFEWTLKAPIADLFTDRGVLLGKHYAGPTWELRSDGSKVVGVVSNKVKARQKDAIPLLLLKAKSHPEPGILGAVNWIQRLDTVGGIAPVTGCDRARQQAEVRVPYTANYYFYRTATP